MITGDALTFLHTHGTCIKHFIPISKVQVAKDEAQPPRPPQVKDLQDRNNMTVPAARDR